MGAQEIGCDPRQVFDDAKADRGPQRRPERPRADVACVLAVAKDRLVAMQQGFGVSQQELHQTAGQRACSLLRDQRVTADEIALAEIHHKAQARLQGRIGVVDIHGKIAVALLKPQRFQRHQPAMHRLYPSRPDTVQQRIMGGVRVLGGDIKLIAKLAHIGHSDHANRNRADVKKAALTEGQRVGRHICARHARKDVA